VLNLYYKNQSVNAVYGNNRCLFSDAHKTHKYTLWPERRILSGIVPSDHRDSEVNRGSLKCTPQSHITTRTHYGVTTVITPCCRYVMTTSE